MDLSSLIDTLEEMRPEIELKGAVEIGKGVCKKFAPGDTIHAEYGFYNLEEGAWIFKLSENSFGAENVQALNQAKKFYFDKIKYLKPLQHFRYPLMVIVFDAKYKKVHRGIMLGESSDEEILICLVDEATLTSVFTKNQKIYLPTKEIARIPYQSIMVDFYGLEFTNQKYAEEILRQAWLDTKPLQLHKKAFILKVDQVKRNGKVPIVRATILQGETGGGDMNLNKWLYSRLKAFERTIGIYNETDAAIKKKSNIR